MYDKNNVFAKILRNELPANKIYENEHALSFHSIGRAAEVHALVIPKGEYVNMYDFAANASPEEQVAFWEAVARAAELTNTTENFNAAVNSGVGPFRTGSVRHFHLHLLGGKALKADVD